MTMQACDRCHSRKTRCDRRFPQCGACEKARVPCVHADKLRQRNIPRGYIDSLESQVEQLRARNKSLLEELASVRAGRDSPPLVSSPSASHVTAPSSSSSQPIPPDNHSEIGAPNDPFAVEVGYLSLEVTGEIRYLGSSSGLGFANIINRVLGVQGGLKSLSSLPPDEDPSPDYVAKTRIPAAPSDTGIPPLAVAMTFVEAYFQHTHIAFPLLHRPSFMSSLEKIYADPFFYDTNPFEAFVFDMVLAIGSSNLNRFDESYARSSTHYARAQTNIATITNLPGLQSLKVILLLSYHGIFSSLRDTVASMWHLVGIGARICFEIGLHLERKNSDASSRIRTVSYDDEMRKRCFWCLYNLDRVVSFTLGRPMAIRDDEIDISLPSYLDDDCFGPNRPIELSTPKGTSPFLHIIRIRRLRGEILQIFYNSKQKKDSPIEERLRIRRKFHDDINAWNADTAQLCLITPNCGGEHVSNYLAAEWYNAVYNNSILLLYRPSPFLPHPISSPLPVDEEPDVVKLLSATKASIGSYVELHRSRRLNYSWITFHCIFVAGLAFVYGVGSMIRDRTMHGALPDVLNIMDLCRRCSNLLMAISERWNTTRQACDLFDRVSSAMIREALNVTRNNGHVDQTFATGRLSSRHLPTGDSMAMNNQTAPASNQSMSTHAEAFESVAAWPTPVIRLDDILTLGDPTHFIEPPTFSGRRDGLVPAEFLPMWPFEFPIGTE